jgi:hypothetical protein
MASVSDSPPRELERMPIGGYELTGWIELEKSITIYLKRSERFAVLTALGLPAQGLH